MSEIREKKITKLMIELAAFFLNRESNRTSLITVTDATISKDLSRGTIFFTVLPEKNEESAIAFANRRKNDFREFVKNHSDMRRIPHFDFEVVRNR